MKNIFFAKRKEFKAVIKNFEEEFNNYIELLKSFDDLEKADLNDFYDDEEMLREDIIKNFKLLKKEYF